MSEAKKEPGQVAYEARTGAVGFWRDVPLDMRETWARAERAVLDHYAPRLTTLEAETRDLHRQLSESRVEAQAQRAGRVEAEHRLGLLVNEAGRRVLAIRSRKLVRRLRKRVAELEAFEGSQTDAAMKGAQEVIALQARVEALMHGSETLEREREEARDGWQRAQQAEAAADAFMRERDFLDTRVRHFVKRAEEAEAKVREVVVELAQAEKDRDTFEGQAQSVAELLDEARKERDEARAEVARLTAALTDAEAHWKAAEGMYCNSATYDTPPCWAKGCGDCGSWSSADREYRCGKHTTRPDAGLAGLAEREAVEPCAPARNRSSFAEAKPEAVERKPPFRDWTDEARAKLVPGASVMWWEGGYHEPRRVVVREVRGGGVWFSEDGNPFPCRAAIDNCDPLTIEPPATQAEPVSLGGNGTGEVRLTEAEPVRAGAPDLRKGDRVRTKALHGSRAWNIVNAPAWSDWSKEWIVLVDGGGFVYAAGLDLATRVRTWQPGEVVPHAPLALKRAFAGCGWASGSGLCICPLAEPWTQTGV